MARRSASSSSEERGDWHNRSSYDWEESAASRRWQAWSERQRGGWQESPDRDSGRAWGQRAGQSASSSNWSEPADRDSGRAWRESADRDSGRAFAEEPEPPARKEWVRGAEERHPDNEVLRCPWPGPFTTTFPKKGEENDWNSTKEFAKGLGLATQLHYFF
jgi:hypothetical protein